MDSEAAHNRGGGSMNTTVKHVEAAGAEGEAMWSKKRKRLSKESE